jgi:hypothetical protein
MLKTADSVNEVLDTLRRLFSEDKPQEALEVVSANLRSGAKVLVNAQGVCLMRLGRYDEAAKVLRDLVYPSTSFAMARDVPEVAKTNLATALLLSQGVDGCQAVLSQLNNRVNPTVIRLQAAIAAWKRRLSLFQRLQCLWGTPNVPVSLDFPPGEL